MTKTRCDREELAYTARGAQCRKFTAYLGDTDYLVSGKCGIPDTFFSIPGYAMVKGARVKGYLTGREGGNYEFRPYKNNFSG